MDVPKNLNKAFSGGIGDALASISPFDPNATLTQFAAAAPNLAFNADISRPIALGTTDVQLTIKGDTHAQLKAFAAATATDDTEKKLLAELGLASYLTANPNRVLMTLDIGGEAALEAQFKGQYNVVKVGASLEAGADARLMYARGYDAGDKAIPSILNFFEQLASTATLARALVADEVIVWELGGYLQVGLDVSAGYKMNGTESFGSGPLEVVEQYGFAVAGSLGFTGELAGRFRVEVRPKQGDVSKSIVTLHKHERRALGVAADVNVGATFKATKTPGLDEVITSLIGVQPKNWLNLVAEAEKLVDPVQLKDKLDKLAEKFILEWTGRAAAKLADLTPDEAKKFFAEVQDVAKEYVKLEQSAVTLFDRFYDENTKQLAAIVSEFKAKLDAIPTIDQLLKQQFDGKEVEILDIITDGRLLELVAKGDAALAKLKARVDAALDLDKPKTAAQTKIRELIVKAKAEFPLDGVLTKLATLDVAALKSQADQKLIGLAERWIGKTVDGLNVQALQPIADALKKVQTTYADFATKFKKTIENTLTQSFSFALHAAYNRASESDALLQLELDLANPAAFGLLHDMGRGDIRAALDPANRAFATILNGTLTDEINRRKTFNINVVGWHGRKWQFQGVDQVLTNVTQRITSDSSGTVTINTTATLNVSKERQRQNEKMLSNFMIEFIGQSNGQELDERSSRFLIDTVSSISSSYKLSFSDDHTTQAELRNYLSFADDLGLAKSDQEAFDNVSSLLPRNASDFGIVNVAYETRFDGDALLAMFRGGIDEKELRDVMRKLVLWRYVNSARPDVGWAYWTKSVFEEFMKLGGGPYITNGRRVVSPIDRSPFAALAAPQAAILGAPGSAISARPLLSAIYAYENRVIAAMKKLSALVASGQPFTTAMMKQELDVLGSALSEYDMLDRGADNTIFAIFDACVRRATGKPSRLSSMRFEARQTATSAPITRMLLA
jgi:hypothetical protein